MNIAIRGYWVTTWMLGMAPEERRAVMKQSLEYMRSGVVVPHTGKPFSLEKVQEAFAEANRPGRSSDGKAMLVTDEKCAQKLKAEL
jgi:NADPH:quinone reductase-like Zn-dependent oxidoreductase